MEARQCTFPDAPNLVDLILKFLTPRECVALGTASTWLQPYALSDPRWAKFYAVEFRHVPARGIIDTSLPIAAIYNRRMLRRQLKNTDPDVRRLGISRHEIRPGGVKMQYGPPADEAGRPSHRSRSRGDSMDESKQPSGAPKPAPADGGSDVAGVGRDVVDPGAMRFVHLSRPNVAVGSTDQGCIAAWLLNPKRPAGMPPSAQGDAFSAASEAKGRRDAKRKYASSQQRENKLVYFKIQAAANKSGRAGLQSVGASAAGSMGADDGGFGSFSMWGEDGTAGGLAGGPADGAEDSTRGSGSVMSVGRTGARDAVSASPTAARRMASNSLDADTGASSVLESSDADGGPTDGGLESDSSGALLQGHAGGGAAHPWLEWQSPEKDKAGGFDRSGRRKGKHGHGHGHRSTGRHDSDDMQGLGDDDAEGSASEAPTGSMSGTPIPGSKARGGKNVSKIDDSGKKLKGKDLWSAADRAKWEEKQQKMKTKKEKGKDKGGKGGALEVLPPALPDMAAVAGAVAVDDATGQEVGSGAAAPLAAALPDDRPRSPVQAQWLKSGPGGRTRSGSGAGGPGSRKSTMEGDGRHPASGMAAGAGPGPSSGRQSPAVDKKGYLPYARGIDRKTGLAIGQAPGPSDDGLPSLADLQAGLLQGLTGPKGTPSEQGQDQDSNDSDGSDDDGAAHDYSTRINLRQGLSADESDLKPSSLVRRGAKANRKAKEQEEWAAAQASKAKKVASGWKLPRQGGTAPAVRVFDDDVSERAVTSRLGPTAGTGTAAGATVQGTGGSGGPSPSSPIGRGAQSSSPKTVSGGLSSIPAAFPIGSPPKGPLPLPLHNLGRPPVSPPLKPSAVVALAAAAAAPLDLSASMFGAGMRPVSPGVGLGLGLPQPSPGLGRVPSPFAPGLGLTPHAGHASTGFAGATTGSVPGVSMASISPSTGPPSPTAAARPGSAGSGAGAGPGPSSSPSTIQASGPGKPKGSKLRSDIWFAAHWVHQQPPLQRKWQSTVDTSGPGSAAAAAGLHSPPFGFSAEPRPTGTGQALAYHAVVVFADGTLGVIAPYGVSPRPNDSILLPSDKSDGPVTASGAGISADRPDGTRASMDGGKLDASKQAKDGPKASGPSSQPHTGPGVYEAQHLAQPRTKYARQDGGVVVPPWMQRSLTWLERPPGEDRDVISAVTVEPGRPFVRAAPQAASTAASAASSSAASTALPVAAFGTMASPGTTESIVGNAGFIPVVVSDREPDTIFAAFGRAVGVWSYTPSKSGPLLHAAGGEGKVGGLDSNIKPRANSADADITAASPSSPLGKSPAAVGGVGGGLMPGVLTLSSAAKGKKKGKAKEKGDGTPAVSKPVRSPSYDDADVGVHGLQQSITGSGGAAGLAAAPTPTGQDLDRSRLPTGVFRVHSQLVTSVSCNRRPRRRDVVHVPPPSQATPTSAATSAAGAGTGATAAGPTLQEDLTVASGDAGGDVVLWSAITLGKIASLQLSRRGGGQGSSLGLGSGGVFQAASPGGLGAAAGREGVAILKLHDEVLVAGGSEGTVAVWKRRFTKVPAPYGSIAPGLPASAIVPGQHLSLEIEVPPELIFRELRAHSIVRAIAVPPSCVHLCAVATGGGEGDVRLWPVPGMYQSWKQQVQDKDKAWTTTVESANAGPSPMDADVTSGVPAVPTVPPAGPAVSGPSGAAVGPTSTSQGAASNPASLCRVLKGHSARITGLHIDGVKIVSCSLDGTAKIWDLMEHSLGRNVATLRVPAGDELSSLHVNGGDILLGGVHGALHYFRFGRDAGPEGRAEDREGQTFSLGERAAAPAASAPRQASAQQASGGTGPNGGSTILDSLLHGVVGGSAGSRKGGAEAAYGGKSKVANAGGKHGANVRRRGMRDLAALVNFTGSSADLGIEDLDDDDASGGYSPYSPRSGQAHPARHGEVRIQGGLTLHELGQMREIEEEELAIAMAASMAHQDEYEQDEAGLDG